MFYTTIDFLIAIKKSALGNSYSTYCLFQMSCRRTKALTMEQIREMLESPSDDNEDIEYADVIIVQPDPHYLTEEELGNDEDICEQEVKDVSGLLELHTVKKIRRCS